MNYAGEVDWFLQRKNMEHETMEGGTGPKGEELITDRTIFLACMDIPVISTTADRSCITP
jgi:hypothetical protein